VSKRQIVVRNRRPLTSQERHRIEDARAAAVAERESIVARGRRVKRMHEAARASLRETVQLLKAERQAQGITLRELEHRTGIGSGALSRLENDPACNPTVQTLQRIGMALGKQITVQLSD
jgi:hypothetical protein